MKLDGAQCVWVLRQRLIKIRTVQLTQVQKCLYCTNQSIQAGILLPHALVPWYNIGRVES
jgi:hypothetical protein